jgi:hypothetical protein
MKAQTHHPSLIECLDHVIRQWALFQILQITLQLRQARNSSDDPIIPTFRYHLECRVVNTPSKSYFDHCEVVWGYSSFDEVDGFEVRVFEVTFTVAMGNETRWGSRGCGFDMLRGEVGGRYGKRFRMKEQDA